VHSLNLFEASVYPEHERISNVGGTLSLGLLNFFLTMSAGDFLEKLAPDGALQANTLDRYEQLRTSAKP
jgi:hypothetical protein